MKVTSSLSQANQIHIYNNSANAQRIKLARISDNKEVHEEIISKENPRELMALASNPNISETVEQKLIELGKKYPGIIATLLQRTQENG